MSNRDIYIRKLDFYSTFFLKCGNAENTLNTNMVIYRQAGHIDYQIEGG